MSAQNELEKAAAQIATWQAQTRNAMHSAAAAFPTQSRAVQQQQKNGFQHLANLITNYGDFTAPRQPPPPFVPLPSRAKDPIQPPGYPHLPASGGAPSNYSLAAAAATCPTQALPPRPVASHQVKSPSRANPSSDPEPAPSPESFIAPRVRWRLFKVDIATLCTLDSPALHTTPPLDRETIEQDLQVCRGSSRALSSATLLIEACFPDSLATRLRLAQTNQHGLVNTIYKLIHELTMLHLAPREKRAISLMSGRAVPVYLVRAGRLCSLRLAWIKRDKRSRDATCFIAVKKAGPWNSYQSMYVAFRQHPLMEDLEYFELSRTAFTLASLPPKQA